MNRLMYKENLYLRKQNLKLKKKIGAIFKKKMEIPGTVIHSIHHFTFGIIF